MVAWFLIAIATLIIFAFIAVNSVQSLAMASDAGARIETGKRLDAAASALISRAASPDNDGVIYLPLGGINPGGNGYGLPAYLALKGQTPFGQRFVYCPFGDAGGFGTTVPIPSADGTSYNVAAVPFEGQDYVTGGRPSYPSLAGQPNVIGFVMAPRSRRSATPSCGDVAYNSTTSKFEAPDALVRPLTREHGVDADRTIDARKVAFYVSPSGAGTGMSASDPTSLKEATDFYEAKTPAFMTINMAAGNYGMLARDLYVPTNNALAGSTLKIRGVQNATFVDMEPNAMIQIAGDLSIDGVTFDSDTTVKVEANTKFTMVNSSVGRIHTTGDTVLVGTNSITWPIDTYSFVIVAGGTATVEGTLRFITPWGLGFQTTDGSSLTLNYARVVFSRGNGGLYDRGILLSGGDLTARYTNLEYPEGTAFGILARAADVQMTQVSMLFSGPQSVKGIRANQGTNLIVHASEIGSGVAPKYGIDAAQAAVVSGKNTTVFGANSCWRGSQFTHSAPGSAGNMSGVLPDVPVPGISAMPTAAEVQAQGEALAINSRRALLRVSNTSEWACS